ncbi:MAG: DUF819 family protein [Candidatus Omnitrophica bacterium]|nr:DUF819 family protein [Candidatus Omnitrophota bacterium]
MIHNPYTTIALLALIEFLILYFSSRERFKKYFHFIPPVFWIYAIPMLLASLGVIDPDNRLYKIISENVLPASLILLLLSTDLAAIAKLGKKALLMMLIGSASIMAAFPTVFYVFKGLVGARMWSGFGALSASWVGGSANMVAVKEALGTPESVFAPMLVVDTVVPYVWMAFLIAIVGLQNAFDKKIRADMQVMDELNQHLSQQQSLAKCFSVTGIGWIIATAVGGVIIAKTGADYLPVIQNTISNYTWVIIMASFIGIGLSLTPARKLEQAHSTQIGYWLLYFVLTTIGAKACIRDFGAALILIGAGFCVITLHGLILVIAAKILRAPMFLAVTASQANIGGTASAPVVAAVYQPALASVGLIMAILGNIMGTYTGILTGYVCKIIAGA